MEFNPKKTLEYELEVGELLAFKQGFLIGKYYLGLGYAGMLSKEIFSMTLEESLSSKNVFYPVSLKEITSPCKKYKFKILSVDAEKIKLKYLGKEK